MKNFQKIQILSSVIPFWSTVFVAICSMVELKKNKASPKIWAYYILTFLASGSIVLLVNKFIMSGQHLLLNVLVTGLILAITNIIFVNLQCMSAKTEQPKTRGNTQTYRIIFVVAGVLALIGCIVVLVIYFQPTSHIEDINGADNTELAVIAQDEILSSQDVYTAFSLHTGYDGAKTHVVGKMKDYDYEECSLSCKKLSGTYTLQATKTDANQLTLDITSQLDEGNMEIVIIVDGELYTSLPVNQEYSITLIDIAGKTILVKIAAESAKMEAYVKRTPF